MKEIGRVRENLWRRRNGMCKGLKAGRNMAFSRSQEIGVQVQGGGGEYVTWTKYEASREQTS